MPNLYDLERIRDLDLAALERQSARRHDSRVSPGHPSMALRVALEWVAARLRTLSFRHVPPVRGPLRETVPTARP